MFEQTSLEFPPEDSRLKMKFLQFHKDNPAVYVLLKKYTFIAINEGLKHYGIAAVFERMRWHVAFETTDYDFKLNNDYKAFYARKFHSDFPEHKGFFATRKQISNDN